MAIALELCDTINVYGMVAPDFCRWVGFGTGHSAVGHKRFNDMYAIGIITPMITNRQFITYYYFCSGK